MEKISNLFQKGVLVKNTSDRWKGFQVKCSPEEFRTLFANAVSEVIAEYNVDFVVDDSNKDFINNLYYYISGSPRYEGRHGNGILLMGSIGIGKTLLMDVLCKFYEKYARKIVLKIHAKALFSEINAKGLEYFRNRPLFIDDLGKEEKAPMLYGTTMKPFEDLMAVRYENRALTFITTNYKQKSLEEMYSQHTVDRLQEMTDTFVMTGDSRRKSTK
jgi:DNA replication protein DnaC